MNGWDELIAMAMLGADRQPYRPPDAGGAVRPLLGAIDAGDAPAALLDAAAVLATYRLAGVKPRGDAPPLPEPAPAETRPPVPDPAGERLLRNLAGEHREALGEWLDAVAAAGKRVPFRALPHLLEAGRASAEVRNVLPRVIGERGQWLLKQNPDWQYAAVATDPAVWETGQRAERVALLSHLRATDAALARSLVASSWEREEPEFRSAILGAMEQGLDPADEPFLEAALDDKRKDVRRRAADLLARLPGSALVARMIARLEPLVRLQRKGPGKIVLDVTLPATPDKPAQRDGVEPAKPAGTWLGEKAWWLSQIVGAVPPSHWTGGGDGAPSPDVLLKAAEKTEWGRLFRAAWTTAAIRHRDPVWAAAVLAVRPAVDEETEQLLALLTPAAREAHVAAQLAEGSAAKVEVLSLLTSLPRPWGPALSRRFLDLLRQHVGAKGVSSSEGWHLRTTLKKFGYTLDASTAAGAGAGWPTDSKHWPQWSAGVEEMLSVLGFRHDMLKEVA